jgi:ParB-like chromosome segregation protein Spo0J
VGKHKQMKRDERFRLVNVRDIKVGERFRKDLGDIAGLAKSIRDVGLLQPPLVTPDLELVAGYRRLMAAAKELDWTTIGVYVVNLDDPLRAEHDENVCRKDFTPSEKVAIARAIEERERAQAARRKRAGTNQYTEPSGKLPEGSRGDTRDKVAAKVGMSGRTLDKAKAVVEAAEQDPGLVPVVEDMDRTGKVDPAFQKVWEAQGRPPFPKTRPAEKSPLREVDRIQQCLRESEKLKIAGGGKRSKREPPDLITVIGDWTAQMKQWARQLDQVLPHTDYINSQPKVAESLRKAAIDLMTDLDQLVSELTDTEVDWQPEHPNGEIKVKGVGIIRGHEAINCLIRIPKNDALRKRGFQVVTDWIRHNR